MKIHSDGADYFHEDGRTERQDENRSRFS